MPDKLKISSNERVDLVDYVKGANDYTTEAIAFTAEKSLLDLRSRVLEGFFLEVSDQTSFPGQITVYNGYAFDRDGVTLNDESLANASSTITLAGASQTFYIEIEYTESDAAQDARAFWDPTIVNTVPIPNGGEVSVNVPTRIEPNWRIVYPVSNSGFEVTSNPNSVKIPVALLNTNASNQITNAVNSYGSLVNASTKSEGDVIATAGTVKVLDSKLFRIGSIFTFDLGGTNPETSRTVVSNDLDNNIIGFTPGLVFNHDAGAIIRQTGVTAQFLPQTLDPNDPAFLAVSPANRPNDQIKRLWQGDETRGSSFLKSKTTFGARNDLDIRSLKDEIDFLAAIVRDMKFGNPRADSVNNAPPASFSARPRYFDAAGGIQGARTAYVTVGNGTTTFGDYNGTSQLAFIAAENALPANGGTIYVKAGTYVFTGVWNFSKPNVQVIGDDKTTCIIQNNNASPCVGISSQRVIRFKDISFTTGTGSTNSITIDNSTLFSEQCEHTGIVGTTSAAIVADYSDFNNVITGTSLEDCYFNGCNFTVTGNAVTGTGVNLSFIGCNFITTNSALFMTSVTNLLVDNCIITTSSSQRSLAFTGATNTCKFSNTTISGTNIGGDAIVLLTSGTNVIFDKCTVLGNMTSTSAIAYGVLVETGLAEVNLNGCTLIATGTYTTGINRAAVGSTIALHVGNSNVQALTGVFLATGTSGYARIINNVFSNTNSIVNASGITVTNCTAPIVINGNKFNINGTSGGIKRGVYVTSTVLTDVTVTNNSFDTFSSSNAYGVYAVSTNSDALLKVISNNFNSTTTAVGSWTGVYTENTTTEITHNTFAKVTSNGSNINCVVLGTYPAVNRINCSNNVFSNLTTTNGFISCITGNVGTDQDTVLFSANTITDIAITGSTSGVVRILTDAGSSNTGVITNIIGNSFTNCNIGTTATTHQLINVVRGSSNISNNVISTLVSPGATLIRVISVENGLGVTVSGNSITNVTSTTSIDAIYINAEIATVTSNSIASSTCTGTMVGISIPDTAAHGTISSNKFYGISGNTNTYCLYILSVEDVVITDNIFDTGAVVGTVTNTVVLGGGKGLVVSKNLFLSDNNTGVDLSVNGSISDVTINGNQFGSICTTNLNLDLGVNTDNNSLFNITDNVFDSNGAAIANHCPIRFVAHASGASGGTGGINISRNIINRANHTTAKGIVFSVPVAGPHLIADIAINDNQIFETGTAVPTTFGIDVKGVLTGFTTSMLNRVQVNGNTTAMNATSGSRGFFNPQYINHLQFCNNTIACDTGASPLVVMTTVGGFLASNNDIQTDTTAAIFDGTSTSGNGVIVGNIIQNPTGNVDDNFATTTVANNRVW